MPTGATPNHNAAAAGSSLARFIQCRSPAVGFHATCALFHDTCARVPPILRQPYNTASARVARCGTTRGLAQDWWNFPQDRRTSRGTRAHLAWNSALHRPCIGASRVESYNGSAGSAHLSGLAQLL